MGREVERTMGGAKGGETVIGIHYVRGKDLFSIKGRDQRSSAHRLAPWLTFCSLSYTIQGQLCHCPQLAGPSYRNH